jgi:hypothetical protein
VAGFREEAGLSDCAFAMGRIVAWVHATGTSGLLHLRPSRLPRSDLECMSARPEGLRPVPYGSGLCVSLPEAHAAAFIDRAIGTITKRFVIACRGLARPVLVDEVAVSLGHDLRSCGDTQ